MQRPIQSEQKSAFLTPPKVDPKHLNANGKLFSENEIKNAIQIMENNKPPLSRMKWYTQAGHRFTILKMEGPDGKPKFCAMYHGVKSGKHLGQGGFGKVKLMQDLTSGEWSAVKIQKCNSPELAQAAVDEFNALQKFGQANANILYRNEYNKYGQVQQHAIIAMKYIPGMNLNDALPLLATKTAEENLQVAINVLNSIKKYHKEGFIHRDIKPQNLMFDPNDLSIKSIDFGLMKNVSKTGGIFSGGGCGTPGFMAPEVWTAYQKSANVNYSEKTDVFALGHTLEEMELWKRVPPENQQTVRQLITQMQATRPEDRPPLNDALHLLQQIQKNLPDQYKSSPPAKRMSEPAQPAIPPAAQLQTHLTHFCNQVESEVQKQPIVRREMIQKEISRDMDVIKNIGNKAEQLVLNIVKSNSVLPRIMTGLTSAMDSICKRLPSISELANRTLSGIANLFNTSYKPIAHISQPNLYELNGLIAKNKEILKIPTHMLQTATNAALFTKMEKDTKTTLEQVNLFLKTYNGPDKQAYQVAKNQLEEISKEAKAIREPPKPVEQQEVGYSRRSFK